MSQKEFQVVRLKFQSFEAVEYESFLDRVDNSCFSEGEWIEALQLLSAELMKMKREMSFQEALGYLTCVSESFENTAFVPKMTDALSSMISEFGIERSKTSFVPENS